MYDIAIIGGGPAGLSAAITARARNQNVAVFTNPISKNPLYRSKHVSNYPGMPNVTGSALLDAFAAQAGEMGAEFIYRRVVSALDMGGTFMLNTGSDVYEARSLIMAVGASGRVAFPGEDKYLGAGVSYCATCDGMLYRGKKTVVIGMSDDAPEEANALLKMGCKVMYTGKNARPEALDPDIEFVPLGKVEIVGDGTVKAVKIGDNTYEADGVFILRDSVAPTGIMPEIATEEGRVARDSAMRTNVAGVFAAGDCTGKPLQITKATGEGTTAAISAAEWVASQSL